MWVDCEPKQKTYNLANLLSKLTKLLDFEVSFAEKTSKKNRTTIKP